MEAEESAAGRKLEQAQNALNLASEEFNEARRAASAKRATFQARSGRTRAQIEESLEATRRHRASFQPLPTTSVDPLIDKRVSAAGKIGTLCGFVGTDDAVLILDDGSRATVPRRQLMPA